jgi:hypothetical protein
MVPNSGWVLIILRLMNTFSHSCFSVNAYLQACRRIAPYILGTILLLIGVFSYYVNTMPLKIEPAAASDSPSVPLEAEEKVEVPPTEMPEQMEDEVKEESSDDEPVGEL